MASTQACRQRAGGLDKVSLTEATRDAMRAEFVSMANFVFVLHVCDTLRPAASQS